MSAESIPEVDLVPLALIAAETGEPLERVAHRFAEAVQLDHVGMRAVSASSARAFFTERAEQRTRQEEQSRRRQEELARKVRLGPRGILSSRTRTAGSRRTRSSSRRVSGGRARSR